MDTLTAGFGGRFVLVTVNVATSPAHKIAKSAARSAVISSNSDTLMFAMVEQPFASTTFQE